MQMGHSNTVFREERLKEEKKRLTRCFLCRLVTHSNTYLVRTHKSKEIQVNPSWERYHNLEHKNKEPSLQKSVQMDETYNINQTLCK